MKTKKPGTDAPTQPTVSSKLMENYLVAKAIDAQQQIVTFENKDGELELFTIGSSIPTGTASCSASRTAASSSRSPTLRAGVPELFIIQNNGRIYDLDQSTPAWVQIPSVNDALSFVGIAAAITGDNETLMVFGLTANGQLYQSSHSTSTSKSPSDWTTFGAIAEDVAQFAAGTDSSGIPLAGGVDRHPVPHAAVQEADRQRHELGRRRVVDHRAAGDAAVQAAAQRRGAVPGRGERRGVQDDVHLELAAQPVPGSVGRRELGAQDPCVARSWFSSCACRGG